MTALGGAALTVAAVLISSGVGVFAAMIALNCYPWRRCGRCGRNEWRIFRRWSK